MTSAMAFRRFSRSRSNALLPVRVKDRTTDLPSFPLLRSSRPVLDDAGPSLLERRCGIVGLTLAAAAILGEADIGYRAAAVSAETSSPVTCTINQLGTSVWTNTYR